MSWNLVNTYDDNPESLASGHKEWNFQMLVFTVNPENPRYAPAVPNKTLILLKA